MKLIYIIFFLFFNLILITVSKAQDLAWTPGDNITLEISSLAIIETNNAAISLILTTSNPGAILSPVSNSDLYLKFSSIVPTGTSRKITAKISSGTIPAGTKLTLESSPCTITNSGGHLGTNVTSPIILSSTDQDLITDIKSCYTGSGINDGYNMTFTWAPNYPAANYNQIEATNSNITVTFTITAPIGI